MSYAERHDLLGPMMKEGKAEGTRGLGKLKQTTDLLI